MKYVQSKQEKQVNDVALVFFLLLSMNMLYTFF